MSEETKKIELGREGLYDARKLGVPKMLVLGVQHTFAMFGATVLVPILTGISVSTALLFAGIGTLLFHLLTKGKVPAFLGSSFAFLGGYAAVAPLGADGTPSEMLPYAAGGIVVSGLIYVILSALIKVFGVRKIMRFFPPVVTGPIIISIGLILAPSAIGNVQQCWWLGVITMAIIIGCAVFGKGMIGIIPILLGVVGGAQFILGMRLHTLIYAAKMGTPVIGLTYDPKVEATMRYIGQEFTEPVEHVNPITICRYVDRIVAEHDTLTAALKSAGQESENKAIENTRLALELLILAALAALCVLAAQYPVLRLEWEARCAVEEEHPGRAERVWRGRVSGSGAGDQAVMVRSGAAAGLSVLTWYEGSPSFFIWRGPIPEGLTVTAVPGGSGPPLEYMALELPEGAVSGRLTAELLGGDVRTADSVREGEVMVFRFREAELNWRQELAYQRAETSWRAALASAPYTLTLWDRNGVLISETKGTMGSIWR